MTRRVTGSAFRAMQHVSGLGSGSAVGIKLFNEVADHAPRSLTWRELCVLMILAEEANDQSRECWPGYEGESEHSARFRARVRCSRSQYYETIKSLVGKGVIEPTVRGQKGQRAHYIFPPLGPQRARSVESETGDGGLQGPGSQDPEADADASGNSVQGPGNRDAEPAFRVPETRTQSGLQGPETKDPEPVFRVPETRTQSDGSGSRKLGPSPAFRVPVSGIQGPGLQDPVPSVPSKSKPLSLAFQLIHSAGVVADGEERDLEIWINKTRRPGSNAWWRTVADNGDLAALADAWQRTRPADSRTAADVIAEATGHQPPRPPAPGYDDKTAYRDAQAVLAALDPDRAADLLLQAQARLLAEGYNPTVTSQYILAAELSETAPARHGDQHPAGPQEHPADPEQHEPTPVDDLDYARAQRALRALSTALRDGYLTAARRDLAAGGIEPTTRALTFRAYQLLATPESA